MNKTLVIPVIFASFILISGSPRDVPSQRETPFSSVSENAVDSLLRGMNLNEKLAQFFVLRSLPEDLSLEPGGFLLPYESYREGPPRATGHILSPLLGIDLIGDESAYTLLHLPKAPQLAAVQDKDLVYNYAVALGNVMQGEGIAFVMGPSLDIEHNEVSPFTTDNVYGSDAETVRFTADAFIRGMRTSGIINVAGNFPGMGSTLRGYEESPPIVYANRREFYSEELVPFKALINEGLQGILMGNAFVPGLDSSLNMMASHSAIVHRTLTQQMGFNGLIFSDFTDTEFAPKSIQQAFLAGNDLIIIDHQLDEGIRALRKLMEDDAIDQEAIDDRCRRILQVKLWTQKKNKNVSPLVKAQRNIQLELKEREIYSESLVLLKNEKDMLPVKRLDTLSLAVVKIGHYQNPSLTDLVQRYAPATAFHIDHFNPEEGLQAFIDQAHRFNHVLIIAEPANDKEYKKRFGLGEHMQLVIERIGAEMPATFVWNGNSKAYRYLSNPDLFRVLMAGHAAAPWSDDLALQAFFGGRPITGTMKKSVNEALELEAPLTTSKTRLAYGMPEEVGIDREDLKKIDSIARKGIAEMAYPGCQVFFAKDGVVVVNQAYGYHTYQCEQEVLTTDLYDLASITKIAGSVAGLMKLSDQGKFNLDYNLCDYIPEWVDTTHYMQLNMREILAHQAGLTPFIPFYSKTITKGVPRYDVYSLAQSDTYPLRVAREFYIRGDYPDKMFREIINYKLSPEKKYKYSDIGYYFALRIIERQSGMRMEVFLDSTYYRPLGLSTMTYRPLERFDKSRITPTEYDRIFRQQLIHGDVHDPGAAMLGGVGGHAGLFSNANDLGILMQMYLNGGSYGDEYYVRPETINEFVKCQFCENDNRRGAGFDKPMRDGTEGPSCGCTNLEAFGHQGFTGTVTWADPGENIVYVFLSNRVYPDANNRKLLDLNIRTEIQKAFYEAVEKSKDIAAE